MSSCFEKNFTAMTTTGMPPSCAVGEGRLMMEACGNPESGGDGRGVMRQEGKKGFCVVMASSLLSGVSKLKRRKDDDDD